ncbi:MAG: helix-turn-helix transcriptional regulator [Nitrospirae bacterium]|nr:helix-turn-helix transcriptional regulator [Nitrospirota bacterium]MBU6483079.1 helix-turn-helix transcriptional regulator [Nitrospirota bacterium]MDE3040960.1 helix-turn-helix transcriptional regulator [Nitrospirota bacterium]MDE3220441.1 helix-turn-helix transcriptional regulator [Nitrospirota bacterium]
MTRLKELREARGLSLRKLATMADVHFVTLARLEAGKLDPRLSTLLKLCKVLGVSLTELVGKKPFKKGGR